MMAKPDNSSGTSRRLRRGLLILCLFLGGGYLAAHLVLQAVLDADALESLLNGRLAQAPKTEYQVQIGAVQWALWDRSVRVQQIVLRPGSEDKKESDEAKNSAVRSQYAIRIPTLQVDGIRLWPYLWQGELAVGAVRALHPRLQHTQRTVSRKKSKSLGGGALLKFADRIPRVAIRRLTIRDGKFISKRPSPLASQPVRADSVWGISLWVHGIRTDSASLQNARRTLLSDSVRLQVDGARWLAPDRLTALSIEGGRVSTADSTVVLEALSFGPTLSDSAFMKRKGHRLNRVSTSIRRVELRGIDVRQAIRQQDVVARAVVLDSPRVDVFRDNRMPPPPTDPPPKMPNELVRSLRSTIRLDTIFVRRGAIRYAKWKPDAPRPGHISFKRLSATITNLTNDPHRMSPSTPAVVNATTWVAGAGRLDVTIRLPLLAPHLSLSFEGHLGPMDVRAFNEAFVPLSGVRIEDGHVQRLQFSAEVQNGRAQGRLNGVYRALDVKMMNPDGGRGLGSRIRTLILGRVLLNSGNLEGEPSSRTGIIDHERAESDSFFKFLWHSVRSGLFSLVGL